MNNQQSFQRKIIYFSLIGVLLLPLYMLSLPATMRKDGDKWSEVEGGILAQIRKQHNLSQTNLGEVDPTSATMKLCSFGLQGVAENRLWTTAIDAKEREDWTTFDASLQQITNLQPHCVKVWQFQSHNVAYNISCEFDDYHDRYHHVIKGLKLLERGIRYNDHSPHLVRDMALFTAFKIGKSDEADLFRPMYRQDEDFHGTDRMALTRFQGRPRHLRDNWQVAKWWYQWCDRLLDEKIASYMSLNSAVVHSDAPHMQIQFAKSLEDDGHFGDAALGEWAQAGREWQNLGLRRLVTSQGTPIHLEEFNSQRQQTLALLVELDRLASDEPGLRDKLIAARRATLTDQERAALDMDPTKRDQKQVNLAEMANSKMRISPRDVAMAMKPAHRDEALRLADRLITAQARLDLIAKYRDIVNYDYWRIRCDVERLPETMAARKAIYEGNKAFAASDLNLALKRYNEGIEAWKHVTEAYPPLLQEKTMVMELHQIITKYRRILAQDNRKLPKPFALEAVQQSFHKFVKTGELPADRGEEE
ncbi:MAG: hypothetical protein K8T25_05260 [Planctomycetia bacterium]|nr:hypothetical protein [Planctomycetia bacterium]